MTRKGILLAATAALLYAAPVSAAPKIPANVAAAVADPGRPAADTARDVNRKPAELVAFAGVKPGMTVVDLLPGGGYFTRIFAKAVGAKGRVYAYFGTQYDERVKKAGGDPNDQGAIFSAYPNIDTIHGPIEKLVTPEKVDIIWTDDNYHDMHTKAYGPWDLSVVNKAVYDSLKPRGYYVIVDHAAAPGSGISVVDSLHRIDEDVVKKEVEAAGFKFVAESNVLRNPADDHSKRIFDPAIRGKTDQFVLKFQKR